ncbi:MAG: hypothetical protein ACI4ST_06915 [Candidatus Gallimonas sp.]
MSKNETCTVCVYLSDLKTNKFFHEIIKGIQEEVQTKNITPFFTDDLEELIRTCNKLEEKVAVIVEYSRREAQRILRTMTEHGIHCIFVNMKIEGERRCLKHSSVCHDYEEATRKLILESCRDSAKKMAFLGYNEDSYSDTVKLHLIRELLGEEGKRYDVYPNEGNVQGCLSAFIRRIDEYDVVLCVNDIFIVLLFTSLGNLGNLRVIGSSFLNLSNLYCNDYTTVMLDNRQVGRCAVRAYRLLRKTNSIATLDIKVATKIIHSQDDSSAPVRETEDEEDCPSNIFFNDEQVSELLKLENMFIKCDETDVRILKAIKEGKTYAAIEESEYIAINTIKYRLNRMIWSAGVDGKKRLFELLDKYHLLQ